MEVRCEFPLLRDAFWSENGEGGRVGVLGGARADASVSPGGGATAGRPVSSSAPPSPAKAAEGERGRPAPGGLQALDLGALPRSGAPPSELRARRDKLAYWERRCSPVGEGTWVSAETVARDLPLLREHGITHVVNCVGSLYPAHHAGQLSYKTLHLQDAPGEDILSVLYDVFDFIARAKRTRGRVLLHCSQGVSRSVSLAIAWIMHRRGIPYDAAFSHVKRCRGVANPNIGFVCQLLQWWTRRGSPPEPGRPRCYRLAPHSPAAPLSLVPRAISSGGPDRLATPSPTKKGKAAEPAARPDEGDAQPGDAQLEEAAPSGDARPGDGTASGDTARCDDPERAGGEGAGATAADPSAAPRVPAPPSPGRGVPPSRRLTPAVLDPRGSFVLHTSHGVVAWVGARAGQPYRQAAIRAAGQIIRYECGPCPAELPDSARGSAARSLGGADGGGSDAPATTEVEGPAKPAAGSEVGGYGITADGTAASAVAAVEGGTKAIGEGANPPAPSSSPASPSPSPRASESPTAPAAVILVEQGGEPEWFWEELGATTEASRALALHEVSTYDADVSLHSQALRAATSVADASSAPSPPGTVERLAPGGVASATLASAADDAVSLEGPRDAARGARDLASPRAAGPRPAASPRSGGKPPLAPANVLTETPRSGRRRFSGGGGLLLTPPPLQVVSSREVAAALAVGSRVRPAPNPSGPSASPSTSDADPPGRPSSPPLPAAGISRGSPRGGTGADAPIPELSPPRGSAQAPSVDAGRAEPGELPGSPMDLAGAARGDDDAPPAHEGAAESPEGDSAAPLQGNGSPSSGGRKTPRGSARPDEPSPNDRQRKLARGRDSLEGFEADE